jgi:hypothetical protein
VTVADRRPGFAVTNVGGAGVSIFDGVVVGGDGGVVGGVVVTGGGGVVGGVVVTGGGGVVGVDDGEATVVGGVGAGGGVGDVGGVVGNVAVGGVVTPAGTNKRRFGDDGPGFATAPTVAEATTWAATCAGVHAGFSPAINAAAPAT